MKFIYINICGTQCRSNDLHIFSFHFFWSLYKTVEAVKPVEAICAPHVDGRLEISSSKTCVNPEESLIASIGCHRPSALGSSLRKTTYQSYHSFIFSTSSRITSSMFGIVCYTTIICLLRNLHFPTQNYCNSV